MSYNIDVERLVDDLAKSLATIIRQLEDFGQVRLPPGVEEGIKWWSLVAVRQTLALVKEAIEAAQIEQHDDTDASKQHRSKGS